MSEPYRNHKPKAYLIQGKEHATEPMTQQRNQRGNQKENLIKLKVSRKKEIKKIGAELNEIEMKKAIKKINETESLFFEKMKFLNL